MKKSILAALVATLLAAPAAAQTSSTIDVSSTYTSATVSATVITINPSWWVWILQPTWKCRRWDLSACTSSDLANPNYRQILVMPSGYTEDERAAFWTDFDTLITRMSNAGTVWSTAKRDRILYVGYFVGGGPLNAPDAAFGGAVLPHPIRENALSLSLEAVQQKVAQIRGGDIPNLKPMAVQIVLNNFDDVTANAAPPSFLGGSYGIAKMNRKDLESGYIGTHELAHAGLNFVDEYVEPGFENINIRSIDAATPLVLFDGSWSGFIRAISDLFGVYDYNISEILANNGNHNVATLSVPSTVYSPISAPQVYSYQGGMFFGKGTYHAAGKNLMNSDRYNPSSQNGFAYAHSGAQWMLINTAFGDHPYRANDRLRTAGPTDGWWGELGSTTTVMMFDGDKRNHFHRTLSYSVQVGWWERVWFTNWWGPFPYPDYRDEWRTAQKTVYPKERRIQLQATSLYGLANLTQNVLCGLGISEVPKPSGGVFKLCEQPLSTIAGAFLPTFIFRVPYEETTVPASQWFTTYWWRFATYNGHAYSGWTGWSSFYRTF